jgi:hypothetical protein
MKTIVSLFFLFALLIFGCNQEKMKLPGKIVVKRTTGECEIYEGSITPVKRFKLKQDASVDYSGLHWANRSDTFFGTESIDSGARKDYKSNVVKFDLSGNLISRIYESEKGQIVGFTYPSRSDKWLLFTSEKVGDLNENPLEGLMRMQSIFTFDLSSNKVVDTLSDVGYSPFFQIHENPWLYDETGFIYTLVEDDGQENDQKVAGVYRHNLFEPGSKLIVANGRYAVASQTSNKIAYIKNKSIFVMSLDDNIEKEIYATAFNEGLRDMHWTPDGRYIYLVYSRNYVFNLFTTGEKLIDSLTGDELEIEGIRHGSLMYSWR